MSQGKLLLIVGSGLGEKKAKLSLLVVTVIQKKDSKTKLPKDRPLPQKEGMNQKVPAKLYRNSSGTERLNFTIFSVHRNLNNRGEGTRRQGWETREKI